MKNYRSTQIVILLIFSVLFFKGLYRQEPILHLGNGLKFDNVSRNKAKCQSTLSLQTYPIEEQPYPIDEDMPPNDLAKPFSNLQLDPARSVEDILATSSTGDVLYISEDLENLLEANRNDERLVEVQPVLHLLDPESDSGLLKVIGPDGRLPIGDENTTFPFPAIVRLGFRWLDTGRESWCTGWLVGQSSVLLLGIAYMMQLVIRQLQPQA
jgi:hypothetical protein